MSETIWPYWKRGVEASLETTEHEEGNILLTKDTGKLFIDIDGNRVQVTDFVIATEADILATTSPLDKMYFATDTGKIYYYSDGGWVTNESTGTADLADAIAATSSTSTQAYILATTGSGTTPIYDTGVYLGTTAGSLYATTFNGYTLAAACAYSVTNITSNTTITTGTGLTTMNTLYYSLAQINGARQSGAVSIYAPTSAGTSGYVLTSSGSGAPTWTAQSSLSVGSATKATQDGNGNVISSTYATLDSAALTGTPTAPTATAGSSSSQIATTSFVTTAVANAVGGVISFEYTIVDTLPSTGEAGYIYLVADSHEESTDNYDEYIWISDNSSYEKIGNTDMDLSDYVTLTGSQAITNKTYNGYTLAAACAYSVTNITSNTTITTGTGLTTMNTLYYSLAQINGARQSGAVSIYAPTSAGTSGYILTSNGSGAPSWTAVSGLSAGNAASADTATIAETVEATSSTSTQAYILAVTASGTTPIYDTGVYLGTTAGSLYATTFNGYTLAAACAYSVTDSSSASAISTGTSLTTERDVYYGLPTINGSHTYTSSTTIYAPTSAGTSGYILTSSGSGAPTWTATTSITVSNATSADNATTADSATTATSATSATNATNSTNVYSTLSTTAGTYYIDMHATASSANKALIHNAYSYIMTSAGTTSSVGYNILALGNATAAGTDANSAGRVRIYGYGAYYWDISGANSTTISASRTIYLPNITATGCFIGMSQTTALGSSYQPIYAAANGVATACSVVNNTSSTAVTAAASLVTANTLYYGLATINGASQSRSVSIYAPTSAGTSGYILTSSGSGAPTWKAVDNLSAGSASNADSATIAQTIAATLSTTTQAYVLGITTSGETPIYDTGVYLDTTAGRLTATTVNAGLVTTTTNPTTATGYYPIWVTGSGGKPFINNGFRYYTLEGTADDTGYSQVNLGNSTASGTAANKYGNLIIYGTNTYYWSITGNKAGTGNRSLYLPNAGGCLVVATNNTQVGGTTQPVYISSSGVATAMSGALATTYGGTGTTTGHIAVSTSSTTSTASPSHGGTFTAIDTITRDSYGHVTAVNTKTVTLPSDNNTDTKVTQTVSTTSANYPLLLAPTGQTATTTTTAYFGTAFQANPSTGNLTATTFNGYTLAAACAYSVTDSSSASAISTGTSLTTERDVYYGLPTINGSHTYTSSTTIYAPTSAGTSGYILTSSGSGAPTWTATTSITVSNATTATTLGSSTVGSGTKPIYLSSGTATASSSTVGSGTKPIYMSSGTLTASSSTVGSSTQPVYLSSGTLTAASTMTLYRRALVGQSSSTTTNPYYKFASIQTSTTYDDNSITFHVWCGYGDSSTHLGILTAHFRTTGTAGALDNCQLVWEYAASGVTLSNFVMAYYPDTTNGIFYCELWAIQSTAYRFYHFDVISEGKRSSNSQSLWTLYTTSSAGSESEITSGYTTKTSSLSTIQNPVSGTATTATTATKLGSSTVGSSTKPIYLSSGTATASSSTVGSGTKPIYLSSGTITASSSTVGSGTKPIYLSSGTITVSSSTAGSSSWPIYLNAGTLTSLSMIDCGDEG